jgi:non-canonical poly(A) RNA polymerase PAPD5/7
VRRNLVEEIVDHIQAVVPKAETEVFGSQCTGLALALSDIDIRLVLPALPELSKKRRVERDMRALNKLRKALSKLPRTYSNVAMFHSQFPLISLNQVPTGVQLQIVLAKRDVSRDGKAVAKYMEEYPYLVDLYTVIKTMLAVRGLSDVFMGSIGAYPLFMMIVASLRHNRPTRQDAAGGLVSFLRFWAEFDTSKGLSIEPTELFDKRANIVGTEKYKSLLRVCCSSLTAR